MVGGAEGLGDGLDVDGTVAEGGVGDGVEEAGEEATAVEAGARGEATQDLGLDGEADGEGGLWDDLAGAADAIHDDRIAGVALEDVIEVGGAGGGVAAGDEVEDAALGGEDGDPAALLMQEHGEALGGAVVHDQTGDDGWIDGGEVVGAMLGEGEEMVALIVV